MKQLALTLPGNQQISAPPEIANIVSKTSGYGGNIFAVVINVLFIIAAILSFGFTLYGSIKIIYSEGDPKAIEQARSVILYAIIGLALVFFSYLFINIFGHFFGVNFLNLTGGTQDQKIYLRN